MIDPSTVKSGDCVTGVSEDGNTIWGVVIPPTEEEADNGIVSVARLAKSKGLSLVMECKPKLKKNPKSIHRLRSIVHAEKEEVPSSGLPALAIRIGIYGGEIASITRADGVPVDLMAVVKDYDTGEESYIVFDSVNSVKIASNKKMK